MKAALKKLRDGARHLDWVASVLGVALIVAAVAMVYVPAAIGVAGVALLATGLLIDLGGKD